MSVGGPATPTAPATQAASDQLTTLRQRLADPPEIMHDAGPRILRLCSRHGLFSSKAIDDGTALLLRELASAPMQDRVLDVGCGYGAIGLSLAARWPGAQVALVDADIRAVEATQENAGRNSLVNATVALSPGLRDAPPGPYDLIVANLPAQAGNDALDELLLECRDALAPGGSVVFVVVNGLRRYLQRRLDLLIGNALKAHQGPRHTVLEATLDPHADASSSGGAA